MSQGGSSRVLAMDLSWEGVRRTQDRTHGSGKMVPVQGDMESLPFQKETFDFVYSYGVLHHLPDPRAGLGELVRVMKPGGLLALYVYEDFQTRSLPERWALSLAGLLRKATTRWPQPFLFRLCQIASPIIFLTFTVPYRILKGQPWGRRLAERVPFRHGESWFGLAGDLYDRFAAPIEHRYSQQTMKSWLQAAGLSWVQVVPKRGWVAFGVKP